MIKAHLRSLSGAMVTAYVVSCSCSAIGPTFSPTLNQLISNCLIDNVTEFLVVLQELFSLHLSAYQCNLPIQVIHTATV